MSLVESITSPVSSALISRFLQSSTTYTSALPDKSSNVSSMTFSVTVITSFCVIIFSIKGPVFCRKSLKFFKRLKYAGDLHFCDGEVGGGTDEGGWIKPRSTSIHGNVEHH